MTSKKHRQAIDAALSNALEPPRRRPSPQLDSVLSEYAPPPPESQRPAPSDGQTPSGGQSTTPTAKSPVAPERDFNKRANSLERYALPSGLFPGASKKIYDALYVRTRGAVKPCRTIRATKKDLAKWSGVNNRKTIDMHLRYLQTCGLIERKWELGNTEGYLFEVRLPEETPLVDRGAEGDSPQERTDQKRDRGTDQKLVSDGQSQAAENASTSGGPKTTFKTNTEQDDDETLVRLRAAMKEATGRDVPASALAELDELLAAEFKIAAGRTTVSSGPAFLAEHLRRRLWKKEKRQIEEEGKSEVSGQKLAAKVDASKCPDCFGAGMWYPEGYEKGVAKCQHERLSKGER